MSATSKPSFAATLSKPRAEHSPVVSLPHSRNSSSSSIGPVPQTPTTSTSAMSLSELPTLLSARLQLTVQDGKQHTGYLYAFDPVMAVVALSSIAIPTAGQPAQYNIFKTAQIKSVEVLALPDAASASTWVPPAVAVDRVSQRSQQAFEADVARQMRKGKGVSQLGQDVFDALSKSQCLRLNRVLICIDSSATALPAQWRGTSILVLEDILVNPPEYAQAQVQAGVAHAGQAMRLERVQKVLAGERAKLASSSTVPAPNLQSAPASTDATGWD